MCFHGLNVHVGAAHGALLQALLITIGSLSNRLFENLWVASSHELMSVDINWSISCILLSLMILCKSPSLSVDIHNKGGG